MAAEETQELSVGQRRAQTILKNDPDFFKNIGSTGGKKTQRTRPEVAQFRNVEFARQAGKKGLETQRKRKSGV